MTDPDPHSQHPSTHRRFQGPKCWAVTLMIGLLIGWGLSFVHPGQYQAPEVGAMSLPQAAHVQTSVGAHSPHGPAPSIPLWLCAPFALLLASIALMPFVNSHFWHHHF